MANRRISLQFHGADAQSQKLISHLQQYENKEIIEFLKTHLDWRDWIFEIELRGGGRIEVNVLQCAIIMKNKQVVDYILEQDNIKSIVSDTIHTTNDKEGDNIEEDDWIYGATTLHLAARFFHDCMFRLIEVDKDLVNNQKNDLRFSPMHITAISEFDIGTR